MMMMMENYEELFERCFQVTYFTPVKCGIFKTTELIELSLSKANNIFLQKREYQKQRGLLLRKNMLSEKDPPYFNISERDRLGVF